MSTHARKLARRRKFAAWWRKNHHRQPAHNWLAYHSRNWAYTYALSPEVFSKVQEITRRHFKSEHKRMTQRNAWCLWKITHPVIDERQRMLSDTASHLYKQKTELKELKREIKNEQLAL